jgi:hypothetical protein
LRRNLRRLTPGEVLPFEEWLGETDYPEWRKEQLRECLRRDPFIQRRHFVCNSFVKTEYYSTYKYPRLINSRHDRFKVETGPLFHAIEKVVFQRPEFVKYVPVAQRAAYIYQRLYEPSGRYFATDYTSFEALFVPRVMEACEFQLYSYMARHVGGGDQLIAVIKQALGTRNVMKSAGFKASVKGVRMSGDMCTSLGNGFSNLMLMLFLCKKNGADCTGVVEGDDGLFRISGAAPTKEQFAKLGFRIKMEEHSNVGKAGFCKQYFHTDVRENVVDPRELLAKFGWSHSPLRFGGPAVVQALLRAKADSLAAELPNAPIAGSLVRMVRRCVGEGRRLYDGVRGCATWRDKISRVNPGVVDPRSRDLVAELFGVPVPCQLEIEAYLDSFVQLQPLAGPVAPLMKRDWVEFHNRYCRQYPGGTEVSY